MTKKILLIDCQVFQTPAWHRGMGKYSLNLLSSLFKLEKDLNAELIFNKNLPIEKEVEQALKEICPKTKKTFIDFKIPLKHRNIAEIQKINKKRLDNHISLYTKDISIEYFILALFLDEACVVFPDNAYKILLCYDLIPLLYHSRYYKRIRFDDYLLHFKTIFESDVIVTISQTVADDVSMYLGISHKKLFNIAGASIDRTNQVAIKPDLPLSSKFILMPSGDELRKNNLQAVKGFEEFNTTQGNQYWLVLTSYFSETTKQELKTYCNNLIFSGNITEAEMQWLYKNAELVLFTSEYEGLGLPVLEAVDVGSKVVCSDIAAFKEMSADAFYLCDYTDSSSIASALREAAEDEDWSSKKRHYTAIKRKFNWERSGLLLCDVLKNIPKPELDKTKKANKNRIAIFTPAASGFSTIGKVVASLHDSLSEYFDIDYYFDSGPQHRDIRPDYLSTVATCYNAAQFSAQRYKDYSAVIYHIGNSEYHMETLANAMYLPGYVILHDTFLANLFHDLLHFGYIDSSRLELERLLDGGNVTSSYLTTLLNDQLGIITHSKYAQEVSNNRVMDNKILRITANLPTGSPKYIPERPDKEQISIGLAGILADVKGLSVMESLALDPKLSKAKFHIFGHAFGDLDTLTKLKSYKNIVIHTNPTDFEFQSEMANLDILINYRLEYRGETSSSSIEAMRYGVAVIVRDIGWYSELPDDVVVKVNSEQEVIEAAELLAADTIKRKKVSTRAYEYVKDNHSYEQYASKIAEIINTSIGDSVNMSMSKFLKTKNPNKSSAKRLLERLLRS